MNVNCLEGSKHFHTVSFDSKENIVILINQKKLPHQFSLVKTTDFYQTAAAIQDINRMRPLIKFYLSDGGSLSSTFPAGHVWHLKDRFHDASGRWKNHLYIHFL